VTVHGALFISFHTSLVSDYSLIDLGTNKIALPLSLN